MTTDPNFSSGYSLANMVQETSGELPQTAIVFGPPDSGKTTLVAQLSQKYNMVWIDLDRGFQAALNVIPPERYGNVIPIHVEDSSLKANGVTTVTRIVEARAPVKICTQHGVVSCIPCTKDNLRRIEIDLRNSNTNTILVIDSLTRLADSAMNHTLGPMDLDKMRKPEFDHWNAQGLLIRNIMNRAKQLPCHTIFISHEDEITLPDGTKRIVPIGGSKANSRRIGTFADHTIYCQVKNMKHIAYSKTTSIARIGTGSNNNIALEDGDSILDLFKPKVDLEEFRKTLEFGTDSSPDIPDAVVEVSDEIAEDTVPAPAPATQATTASATASTNALHQMLANRRK